MTILTMQRIGELFQRLRSWPGVDKYSMALAGGCVRDAYMGLPIKDFDLFVTTPTNWQEDPFEAGEEINVLTSILDNHLYSKGVPVGNRILLGEDLGLKPSAVDNAKVFTVWHWAHAFHNLPLDVIFTYESPSDHVKKDFDFGICQAWYGVGGLKTTRAFQKDYFNKTITYLLDDASRPHKMDHANRLKARFPGWKFRNWSFPAA